MRHAWRVLIENEDSTKENHPESGQKLLKEIVLLYTKIRFYAFAKRMTEIYKKENSKNYKNPKVSELRTIHNTPPIN